MKFKILMNIFIIAILCSIASAAEIGRKSQAIGGGGVFTDSELSALPDIIELRTRYYLFERTKTLEKLMAPYKKKFGYGYGTIHHYGVGQIYLNRILFDNSLSATKKAFFLKNAIAEFGFVLNPEKYPKYSELFKKSFLPLVLSKRAEAYMLLENYSNAIGDLFAAIKINPSYSSAYYNLYKCYQSIGDYENATKILKLGKRYIKEK